MFRLPHLPDPGTVTCTHATPCPPASASDRDAAVIVADHRIDVGCVVLCNGVWLFADGGEILPDGRTVSEHRAEPAHRQGVAA